MKAKSLQFGKAMSAALFVMLLSMAGMKNALAQTQVATLQHGDDISVFYGNNAFVEAHTAAADGDIITLSGGTFTSCDITKAITLRGAGMKQDTIAGTVPTTLSGSFSIQIPSNATESLTMEGIRNVNNVEYYDTLSNPTFNRCQFGVITDGSGVGNYIKNATFCNCIVTQQLKLGGYSEVNCINSIIWDPTCSSTTVSNFTFLNCVIYKFDPSKIYASSFQNCIIMHFHTGNGGLPESNTVYYCASVRGGEIFNNHSNGTNWRYVNCEDLFMSFSHNFSSSTPLGWSDVFSFELKEEAQSLYIGSDGEQIGIYGGLLPYNNRPSYMVLKRCNVANRSTIDGKLSVEIEVVTEGE